MTDTPDTTEETVEEPPPSEIPMIPESPMAVVAVDDREDLEPLSWIEVVHGTHPECLNSSTTEVVRIDVDEQDGYVLLPNLQCQRCGATPYVVARSDGSTVGTVQF